MNPLVYEGNVPTLTSRIILYLIKWVSAFTMSFCLATVALGLMNLGVWSFVFVFVAFQAIFWKLLYKANLIFVMIVDAIFAVFVIATQLYIIVGPNF